MAIEFKTVSPVLQVSDVEATLAFFQEKLGFELQFKYGEPTMYGAVNRGPIQLHVSIDYSETGGRVGKGVAYIMLSGVNELYEEFKAKEVPFAVDIDDRPYAMRDFYITDPEGNTIGFGEPNME